MDLKKLFICLLCWMPLEAQQQAQNSSFELSNGLKVVVLTNTRVPVVYHSIWYKVGSTNDPVLKSGMAHYLEHMMFKSTKNHPSGDYMSIVRELGGQANATTSADCTKYYVTVDKKYLEKIMELEADRMENLTIDPKEALLERGVVIEERLQNLDNPPAARLSEMGRAHYYLHHPYRIHVLGWKHEMETYTSEDALAFYKKFYCPNNAILVLSGDITVEEAKKLTQKYYGGIPSGSIVSPLTFQEPSNHNITASLVLKDKDFAAPNLNIWFKGFSWKKDLKKVYALKVVSSLLHGKTGIWYDFLVEKEKISTRFNVNYPLFYYDIDSPLTISMTLPKNGDIEKAKLHLMDLIQKLINEDLNDDDVKLAKIKSTKDFDYIKESATGYGQFVGDLLIKGISLEDIEKIRDQMNAVTKEDLKQVIQEVFSKNPRVITIGLPQEEKVKQ